MFSELWTPEVFVQVLFLTTVALILRICWKQGPAKDKLKKYSNRGRYVPAELPPVFPNGWIPILESSALKKMKVKSVSAIAPEFVKVETWLCREMLGFIFIWYHAEGEAVSWELEDHPEVSCGKLKQSSRFEWLASCHIQEIAANGADIGHLNQLHKPSTFVSTDEFARDAGKSWKGRLASFRYEAEWSSQDTTASTDMSIHTAVLGFEIKPLFMKACLKVLGPALLVVRVQNAFGRLVTVMAVIPVEPLKQRLVHLTFSEPGMPWFVWKLFDSGNRRMLERDVLVWNRKIFKSTSPLQAKEERSLALFNKWYSQFYSPKSPTLKDVMESTMQW